MKRRTFLKASLAAGAAAAVPELLTGPAARAASSDAEPPADAPGSQPLPWQREVPLREAAQSVALESTLSPANPLPNSGGFGNGAAMTVNNLKMRTTIWGPPQRITISLNKNNVWDRRLNTRSFEAPTLQEITEGAFSPANKGFEGRAADSQRPRGYGYLRKEGGFYDGYRQPYEYPMPCMKPVGQIILGIDPLAGAAAPQLSQSCACGVVALQAARDSAKVNVDYVLGMTSNIYAIRGRLAGIDTPVWLRLYRHRDTAHMRYMNADGTAYTLPGTEADKAFNGPMEPPTSGKDGRFFWVRQKMPAEKTFPQGFEYVLMGLISSPGTVDLESVEGKTGLGTPPPDRDIAAAPGAAATATFTPGADGRLDALVTVVTTMDGPLRQAQDRPLRQAQDRPDLLVLAKQRLTDAEAGGFDGIVKENAQWWNSFYDKRESGRIFRGLAGTQCSEDIRALYRSYTDSHGGGTKTDMRQYECSASYGLPERDVQPWTSAPCYNEIFTTPRFVRNWADSEDMWKQLVEHWVQAARDNARDMFSMPGMFITHGYLPPVKPDKYVHTTMTLELCMETMAQLLKPAWDEWDYGGDVEYLRKECYPLVRDMALFYAAYAKKGDDGYYHVIPSMEPERWGYYYEFARNKDVISSLCMFRWGLDRAADAAEVLGVDADLRQQWRQIATQIVPYATWDTAEGSEYCAIRGVEPKHLPGDHFGEAAMYPTILADEINLDSPQAQKDMMLRTVKTLQSSGITGSTLLLLGAVPGGRRRPGDDSEALLNSRSGRIHLFPVVAQADEVAFHDFQARGGFLISACRKADGVYYVEIQARRDNRCQLMNPWPGRQVIIREAGKAEPVPFELDKTNGECLVFAMTAGQKVLVAHLSGSL